MARQAQETVMGDIWEFFTGESGDPCAVTPHQARLIHHHELHGCDNPLYDITIFGNIKCRNCEQKL
jgi:hypothetical protein